MGVLLQAFYWNCPLLEGCEGQWFRTIKAQLPSLAADGFTAQWLPPPTKAAEWNSMGYESLRLLRPWRIRPERQDRNLVWNEAGPR